MFLVNSPVMISWALTTAPVWPARIRPKVFAPAVTTGTPAIYVAELTVALMLATLRRICRDEFDVEEAAFPALMDFVDRMGTGASELQSVKVFRGFDRPRRIALARRPVIEQPVRPALGVGGAEQRGVQEIVVAHAVRHYMECSAAPE